MVVFVIVFGIDFLFIIVVVLKLNLFYFYHQRSESLQQDNFVAIINVGEEPSMIVRSGIFIFYMLKGLVSVYRGSTY